MKKTSVEVKNYIIYAVLVVITMMVVFYLGKWYQKTERYRNDDSVITTVLSEIKLNELDSYLIENPNSVVYVLNYNLDTDTYEDILKDIVVRYDLRDEIIFLNLTDQNDLSQFAQKYLSSNIELKIPNLCVFESGKIVSIMNEKNSLLEEQNTIDFLKKNGVIVE